MIVIETYTSTKFKLDGIPYLKNYISEVAGNQITIFNAYDRKDVRSNWLHYSEITLDGVVYGNVSDLQNALLPVIYTRASLGGATASFDLTVYEEGDTPISNVNEIEVIGATVTDDGGGKVTLEVVGGGGTPTLEEVLTEGNVTTKKFIQKIDDDNYIEYDIDNFRIDFFTTFFGGYDLYKSLSLDGYGGVSVFDANQQADFIGFNNNRKLVITDAGLSLSLGRDSLIRNGIVYLLPSGASSPLATLADITGGGAVDSVNGQTGVVVLGSNQYNQNNITFKNVLGDYFGTITTPRTGTLTFDATDAVTGGISVVYYNNSTLDIPSVWLSVGDFIAGEINKLYFERDSEGYVTLNILNAGGDVTPPSTIGTLTITDE